MEERRRGETMKLLAAKRARRTQVNAAAPEQAVMAAPPTMEASPVPVPWFKRSNDTTIATSMQKHASLSSRRKEEAEEAASKVNSTH